MRSVTFVTGNSKKLREVSAKLASLGVDIELTSKAVDLPELQGTPEVGLNVREDPYGNVIPALPSLQAWTTLIPFNAKKSRYEMHTHRKYPEKSAVWHPLRWMAQSW